MSTTGDGATADKADSDRTSPFVANSWLRQEIGRLELFFRLCREGVTFFAEASRIVEASRLLPNSRYTDEGQFQAALASARKLETFARDEVSAEFPYATRLCVVMLWSLLEAYIVDFAVEFLVDVPRAWQTDRIGRLKVPVSQILEGDVSDRARLVIDMLDREIDSRLKPGIGRFEAVLECIGLGGGVPDSVRLAFFELSQVRNACVHAGARVDKKLITLCPWLDLVAGSDLVVSPTHLHKYRLAVNWYVVELLRRLAKFCYPEEEHDFCKDESDDWVRQCQEAHEACLAAGRPVTPPAPAPP